MHTCVRVLGLRNVSFLDNFANALNELWSVEADLSGKPLFFRSYIITKNVGLNIYFLSLFAQSEYNKNLPAQIFFFSPLFT